MMTSPEGPSDGMLVARALEGDQEAFAALYDRYADRIHDYCTALLRDPAEAADAMQDAFLLAAERLGQLRDPERVRAWLYAIARSACRRRFRSRSRVVVVAEVDAVHDAPDVRTDGDPQAQADADELRALVWAAAAGLSERDQTLLTLQLRHGLGTGEIAEVLDVSAGHAAVLLGRLRDQVERSLGALLVARLGAQDCSVLAGILRGWDGRFTVLIRKRVARHVEACETCAERRAAVLSPAAMLSAVPLVAAPAALRELVLSSARLPSEGHGPEGPDGPVGDARADRARRRSRMVLGVLLVGVVALGGVLAGPARSLWQQEDAPEGSDRDVAAVLSIEPTDEPTRPRDDAPSPLAAEVEATPRTPTVSITTAEPTETTSAPLRDPAEDPPPDSGQAPAPVEITPTQPATPIPAPQPARGSTPAPGPTPAPGSAPTAAPAPAPAPAPARLAVTPTQQEIGSDGSRGTVVVRNDGGGTLRFDVSTSHGWARVSPASGELGAGAEQRLTVEVDRSGHPEGTSEAQVAVRSSAGSASVTVRVRTERPPVISDAAAGRTTIGVAGCGVDRTSVSATITDESGVASAQLRWVAPDGRSGETPMAQRAGRWTAPLGPFSIPGDVTWSIQAVDTRGNTARSGEGVVVVTPCPA